jgi:hypothetical protein
MSVRKFKTSFRIPEDPKRPRGATDHLRVTKTTAAMMIDMATAMIETTAATSTAMTRSQRLTTTSATYLHHQR